MSNPPETPVEILNRDPVAILKAARAIIEDPKHWTSRTFSRLKDGTPCLIDDPNAYSFCAEGALERANPARTETWAAAADFLDAAANKLSDLDGGGIVYINDRRGHAAVLGCFDRAIEAASEEVSK